MGFFKSLKGNHPDRIGGSNTEDDACNHSSQHTDNTFDPPTVPPPSRQTYAPASAYAPPPGPPPGRNEYAAPLGPPPQQRKLASAQEWQARESEYAAPPGPPPGRSQSAEEPPPYHDWTVVPDTALLPPPPSLGYETSPSNNANPIDAMRAHDWCRRYPLIIPHEPTPAQHAIVQNGDIKLIKPQQYEGEVSVTGLGRWKGFTRAGGNDSCLLTSAPLYFALADSPLKTRLKKTIYFEVKIHSLGHGHRVNDGSLALGYCAMPYPTWRLPGWERGSLAVHGDDGRRYVNDTWGGKDFTSAFQVGDTIGLGMSFSISESPPGYAEPHRSTIALNVEVFFTKNGGLSGGWNLHEELDVDDQGIEGLDGNFDCYGAIGSFGGVEFECFFNRQDWLWSL